MHCPSCNNTDTKVIDSRDSNQGTAIRRRRECEKCNFRFSTYEQMELLDILVVKKDGAREPYEREKMEIGLRKALQKRPFGPDDVKAMVSQIERDIQLKSRPVADEENNRREIDSCDIGKMVMRKLKKTDVVAYIRFASVYKSFEDLEQFKQEIKQL